MRMKIRLIEDKYDLNFLEKIKKDFNQRDYSIINSVEHRYYVDNLLRNKSDEEELTELFKKEKNI